MDALNIILGGSLVITLWGAYQMNKRIIGLEIYASVVTSFVKEISTYSDEVTTTKFKNYVDKAYKEAMER
jgi:hypothetical protein